MTKDTKIIGYDSSGYARIFFGIVPELGGEPVVAISKTGYDILTILGTS